MEIYKGREIETEQLNDGKWVVCGQDKNGVMIVARRGMALRDRRRWYRRC